MDKLAQSPPAMGSSAQPSQAQLQRLDFVKAYTELAVSKSYDLADSVYQTTRTYVPKQLEGPVQAVEQKASEISASYGAPFVCAVQDKSSQVLGLVDSQVDGVVKQAEKFYENNASYLSNAVKNQSGYHAKNLQHFKDARDAYLQQAKDAVNFLKKEGLSGTAKKAADSLLATVEQAKAVPNYIGEQANQLLAKVSVAWERLQQMPAVQKTLDTVSPSVELAKKKYIEAHDAVVKAPAYNKAVETGQEVFSKVQTTYVYKTAANRLYPVIAPYADPVVDKVSHSPYVNNAIEHLKPQHTVAASS